MKDFDFRGLLESLTQDGLALKIGVICAVTGLALLFVVYLLRQRRSRLDLAESNLKPAPKIPQTPKQPIKQEAVSSPNIATEDDIFEAPTKAIIVELPATQEPIPSSKPVVEKRPEVAPVKPALTSVAAQTSQRVPQESVLRRHYLTHVRYMVETVSAARPTESVLRRHYDQLIASQVEDCLNDAAKMDRLIKRYDEHRKNTVTRLAA